MTEPGTPLAPFEVATGIVYGVAAPHAALPFGGDPADALQAAVRPALQRGRCFVSFSGGRDSSAVLAAAAHVARREGLEAPVPVTIRARDVPQSHESDWQERVVGHLGLGDWIRIEAGDDLDAVGPCARSLMARHGLLWPFNVHFHVPMLRAASGGTLLTGIGGDELWAASSLHRPGWRRRALRLAPIALRRAALARREPADFPWLTAAGRRAARRAGAADSATEPSAAARRLAWARRVRYLAVGTRSLAAAATDLDASIEHPLLAPPLWGAVAAAAPRDGFATRDGALAAVAGGLLPQEVVGRRTKAGFDGVFFHDHSRAFVREWDGTGAPDRLVDAEALRQHWLGQSPDPHSLTLLQAVALASPGDRLEQTVV
jgi:Asparagine synthase